MKKLMNLNGAKMLSKFEQKSVFGGNPYPGKTIYARCCWDGSNNCSSCQLTDSGSSCVTGAYLTTSGLI